MNDAINPKVAAEKARDTHRKTARRKTTRNVGTGKAHRTDRKTASKVIAEKARGTYRKTAARFEEFAYDAQMPESMRALAEKSVAQTWELYVHSLEAVLESWERFVVAGSWLRFQNLVIHPTHTAHSTAWHGRRARILLRPFGDHGFRCYQEASDRTRVL